MTVDFKPSQVVLNDPVSLGSTFGWAEAEDAATWMIRAMRAKGDAWGDVTLTECREAFRRHAEQRRWPSPSRYVFDPSLLVEGGWADTAGDRIWFTRTGLERLRRWVVSEP